MTPTFLLNHKTEPTKLPRLILLAVQKPPMYLFCCDGVRRIFSVAVNNSPRRLWSPGITFEAQNSKLRSRSGFPLYSFLLWKKNFNSDGAPPFVTIWKLKFTGNSYAKWTWLFTSSTSFSYSKGPCPVGK